jgi:hypothetical protein
MGTITKKKAKGNSSWSDQYSSRFYEYGIPNVPGLVAQIHFPTDKAILDEGDKGVLDSLIDIYQYRLIGDSIRLRIIGYADPRGTNAYNHKLAYRRALAVKEYLDGKLKRYKNYGASIESRGELHPSGNLASDRRVDILSSFIPKKPRIVLPEETIVGEYSGSLSTKFQFRTLLGAGIGIDPVSAQVVTIKIKNSRTGRVATYTYTGAGGGLGGGINRPTDWEEKTVPVYLDVDDFEGNGYITSISAGVAGGNIYTFYGPRERGKANEAIILTFEGWDFNLQFGSDTFGYWHRRD